MKTWQNHASDLGSAVTSWSYHPQQGNLRAKTYADPATGLPGNSSVTYSNSSAGRLARRVWTRGVTTDYTYNNAGELQSINYSDGTPDVTFTYDRRSRRTSASSAPSAVNYAYNDAGQLLTEAYTAGPLAGITVTNGYDALLRRGQLAVVRGQEAVVSPINYQYDAASRLASVTQASLLAQYAYVPGAPGLVSNIAFSAGGTNRIVTTVLTTRS